MILVQNPLLQLSGNKYWIIVLSALFLSACSPKIRPETKKTETPKKVEKIEKPALKVKQATISLLVPFRLDEIKLKSATKADVEKAAIAIDFYQGFKLGVDSAAAAGQNFKLKVYDTQDNNAQIGDLISNGSLLGSNIIVGPVYPDGLKHITNYSISREIPVVNPLAASQPAEFGNPNLISIVNNIDLHAEKIGNYISKNYNPTNTIVVLINPKTASDEIFAKPLRAYFANSKKVFAFQEYGSVFTMETKVVKGKQYVILVSSSDKKFVVPTLDKLMKIKKTGLNISLFGHPEWVKQNYNTEELQAFNTIVSSSYKVDYTRAEVNTFIKKYRAQFNFEPGEYAFKGFDTGFYFGRLLAKYGDDYIKYLTKENYKGLHNSFHFVHDNTSGYINTSLMLLRYKNFALNIIE
ncbi:amino acid ABC transporter substrate-binding protein [Pedobacter hiemivivus]|uniref:Amino acid ABC transporter substrate-binding protein n=1 Tax=Pedobacter hiemivivus TaxID=2530454 RepID=A0A4U1GF37_9SPHI|nr:ABC transporter substrate-binding protein [Pedobacter hiemivivus]TKC61413.1 amino acid ABC transporter substrate-binding protein [Pedobacter hiemivivus]